MLTITTADPNNTQANVNSLINTTRKATKPFAKLVDLPVGTPIATLDNAYQALIDDDIDLYNPHLNVRDAYIRHVEQQNANLKTQINDLQELLSQSDRVILALLASLIVVAAIAVTLAV